MRLHATLKNGKRVEAQSSDKSICIELTDKNRQILSVLARVVSNPNGVVMKISNLTRGTEETIVLLDKTDETGKLQKA